MHKAPSLLRPVRLPSSRPVKILANGTVHLVSICHYSVTQFSRPFLLPHSRRLGLVLASARATLMISSLLTHFRKPPSPYHVYWEASTMSVPERAIQPRLGPASKLQDARRPVRTARYGPIEPSRMPPLAPVALPIRWSTRAKALVKYTPSFYDSTFIYTQ